MLGRSKTSCGSSKKTSLSGRRSSGATSAGTHQCPLALDQSQRFLPGRASTGLDHDRQRLVHVDGVVEQVERALRIALVESVLPEPRRQGNELDRSEVASG